MRCLQEICLPLPQVFACLFFGGALGKVEGILRKGGEGYSGFGRPVTKEVSEVPVLPLESFFSRFVEEALLTTE